MVLATCFHQKITKLLVLRIPIKIDSCVNWWRCYTTIVKVALLKSHQHNVFKVEQKRTKTGTLFPEKAFFNLVFFSQQKLYDQFMPPSYPLICRSYDMKVFSPYLIWSDVRILMYRGVKWELQCIAQMELLDHCTKYYHNFYTRYNVVCMHVSFRIKLHTFTSKAFF